MDQLKSAHEISSLSTRAFSRFARHANLRAERLSNFQQTCSRVSLIRSLLLYHYALEIDAELTSAALSSKKEKKEETADLCGRFRSNTRTVSVLKRFYDRENFDSRIVGHN